MGFPFIAYDRFRNAAFFLKQIIFELGNSAQRSSTHFFHCIQHLAGELNDLKVGSIEL